MTAIRTPDRRRATAYRVFQPGEYSALTRELRRSPPSQRRHWRLLAKLAIEAAAMPRDLAGATWDQFDARFAVWRIPAVRQGDSIIDRHVVMTRAGSRVLRVLHAIADPASPRVFHSLSPSPYALSCAFGHMATRAGLADFCMGDLSTIGLIARTQSARGADIEQILWSLGYRQAFLIAGVRSCAAREILPSAGHVAVGNSFDEPRIRRRLLDGLRHENFTCGFESSLNGAPWGHRNVDSASGTMKRNNERRRPCAASGRSLSEPNGSRLRPVEAPLFGKIHTGQIYSFGLCCDRD